VTLTRSRRQGRAESSGGAARRRDGLLTTGDMARLSESTLRTVRFYEEAGLLQPVQRTEGGHRLFPRSELDKLRLVSDLRSAGFALEEIKEMLELKHGSATGGDASRLIVERLGQQIESMSGRIALLERVRADLEQARRQLSKCCGCRDARHFPDDCGSCGVMTKAERASIAVSVLWDLER
jgi:DNA-binding transcriptional MerR regulator